jgi:hypothetical protein
MKTCVRFCTHLEPDSQNIYPSEDVSNKCCRQEEYTYYNQATFA